MKKILVTGGNSFLAKEFISYFSNYNLIITDRITLDVSNKQQVNNFFKHNEIDYVFHTAIKGGSRLKEDSFQDFIDNLNMYNNLSMNNDKFKLMFNFGSGAEFDRRRNINRFKEKKIMNSNPQDYYGHSKNIIAKEILNKDNIINIRLFGCFGKYENDTRFIKSSILKCLKNEDIIIQDKEMDFISTNDLCLLINNILCNDLIHKDINAVYEKKTNLSYIAEYIKKYLGSRSNITVIEQHNSYSGDATTIKSLDIKFIGLEKSIEEMCDYIKNNND